MIVENAQIYIMRKGFKKAVFALFEDGCYRQIYKNVSMSEVCNDFADLFLTLTSRGWREA